MEPWLNSAKTLLWASAVPLAFRLLGAIGLWIVGTFAIRALRRLAHTVLTRRTIDPLLARYVESAFNVSLNLLLLLVIFEVFGIETASIAAVLVAASFAIGAALSGLLGNLAAGAFILTMRPFKVGDRLILDDAVGEVEALGLFVTTLNTDSNARVFIGNGRFLKENLRNRVRGTLVRVDRSIVLPHGQDPSEAIRALDERIRALPKVSREVAPQIGILERTSAGSVLAVRPFCDSSDYVSVYYETNAVIWETFDAAGYPPPETHHGARGDGLIELDALLEPGQGDGGRAGPGSATARSGP